MDENEKILILRTCAADMVSHNGFRWPTSGPVEAPDWDPEPTRAGGLHGLAYGEGEGDMLNWADSARWLVVSVAKSEIVDLGGKVKFPRGEVVYCGDRSGATSYIMERYPGRAIVGGTATAGDRGTATVGYAGTATVGDYGGTATSGDFGTSTAGFGSTATSGQHGASTAGPFGTAVAGRFGTAAAGAGGKIQIEYHEHGRVHYCVGYVGPGGVEPEPNVRYRVKDGKFVRA